MVVLAADPYKKHVQNASGLLHRIVVVRPRVGPTGAFVTSLFVCLLVACLSTISEVLEVVHLELTPNS